jgi:hypothetical protein
MIKLSGLAVSICLLVGCGDDAGTGSDTLPSGVTASGSFAMTTTIDVTVAAVLPATIYEKLDLLRRLRQDPGGTFFAVLGEAGVPLVDELTAVLPDAVEDKVGDWIGEAIDASFGAELDLVIAASQTALTRFDVLSELDLPALDAQGRATAVHRLRALRFAFSGDTHELALPASSGPLVTQVAVGARVTRGTDGADGLLTLEDHLFGFGYGELAWQLLEAASLRRHGVGFREGLGLLVDCPSVATTVAAKCVLGVCVGHADMLEELCEKGLDYAVEKLHEELATLRFEALRLDDGVADMWDAPVSGGPEDGVLDHLSAGSFECSLDIGMGPRLVPAVFSGQRE